MPTLQPYRGTYYLWHYVPNLPAAIAFTVLFALLTTAHGWRMVRTRMWFCLPFVVGGFFEVIGYIGRASAYNSTGELGPYLVQGVFLVLPPIFFAASVYMVYSRLVRAVQGETFSPISPRWTTRIFVFGDFVCLNIQGGGAGLLFKPKTAQTGSYIVVAGLLLQILLFAAFMAYCLTFNLRFRAHIAETRAKRDMPWQSCLNMLYSTSLLILVRNIFRVVEFILGQDGYLFAYEWPTYALDGVLMFLVMVGFLVWYPSQLQPAARDAMIELTAGGTGSAESGRAVKNASPAL